MMVLVMLVCWTSAQTVSFSLSAANAVEISRLLSEGNAGNAGPTPVTELADENAAPGDGRPCLLTCFAELEICVSQCATQPSAIPAAATDLAACGRLQPREPGILAGKTVPVDPAPPKDLRSTPPPGNPGRINHEISEQRNVFAKFAGEKPDQSH